MPCAFPGDVDCSIYTYLFYECCHTCYSVGLVLREFKFSLRLCNNFQSRLNFLNYPFRDEISVRFLLDRRNIMKALRVDNTLCKIYCTQFLSKLSNLELCTQCIMHRTIIVCSIGQWGTSLFYLDFSVYQVQWPWPQCLWMNSMKIREIKLELLDKQNSLALNSTVQVVNDLR